MNNAWAPRRLGLAGGLLAVCLLVVAFVPAANADTLKKGTRVTGFDTSYATTVFIQGERGLVTDRIRVRTGGAFEVRKVQVQSRYLGTQDPSAPVPWVVESTGTTDSLGFFNVEMRPDKMSLWEYRVRVVPTDSAWGAVTPPKQVRAIVLGPP